MTDTPASTHNSKVAHLDLRDFLAQAEMAGEVFRISGVDSMLEIGALTEIVCNGHPGAAPAILFDDIPGYPGGYRLLSGTMNSTKRMALALGLPLSERPLDVVQSFRELMKRHAPISARTVTAGPVLDNIVSGDDVDVLGFPAPLLHEHDGSRYIGTDDLVIMRDPDTGWVNVGCYRIAVHSKARVGLFITPGKHGYQIRKKYFDRGEPCPVVISLGHDPLLSHAAGHDVPFGTSEFAFAGGLRGEPFEIIESAIYGLPMPAHSEVVLEGAMRPGDMELEGPFGEFTGYYAGERSPHPVVQVERIYHRDNPIITIATPMVPPSDFSFSRCLSRSGMIWDQVEKAGLSGITGVWCHEAGVGRLFNVIAVKQAYPGHAKQAGMMAASCQSATYFGRFVIVVDDDIDPSNLEQVIWAMSTRCDPDRDIDTIRRMWTGGIDPMVGPGQLNSRAVIDACRPFERLANFPPVARTSAELRAKVASKFAADLARL
jgi:4-hydroxy-3-polyprenylbenzoate decarboxylase